MQQITIINTIAAKEEKKATITKETQAITKTTATATATTTIEETYRETKQQYTRNNELEEQTHQEGAQAQHHFDGMRQSPP